MIQIQYTLFCTTGQYKPVSCIINVEDVKDFNARPKYYQSLAIRKICFKRYWTTKDLKKYGYTQIKYRRYEKEV